MVIRLATVVLLLLIAPFGAPADEPGVVFGRVVDPAGLPAAGAEVSAFWGANGLRWEQVEAVRDKEPDKLWHNEGKMEPWGAHRSATDADGRFLILAPERMKTLLIYDRQRRLGAVALFDPKRLDQPVGVRLAPLVRIFGTNRLAGAEGPLQWTCTYLNLPFDEKDPLNRTRMAICGSHEARFEFLVPPGTYDLGANNNGASAATIEDRRVVITTDQKEVDLGGLVLRPRAGGIQNLTDRAKAKGTWGDYKQNFGKQPPPWHLTDAKGVAKDAKLSDFRGKWAVLYFWGPNRGPCLGPDLSKLMAFHEAHKAQRDRFEILAFCCDFGETLADIPALERQLADVKKAVWGGKDLPFPVLLDNTFQTYERFGLEGNGVSNTLLIDPEGRLVEGDLESLSKKLDRPDERPR